MNYLKRRERQNQNFNKNAPSHKPIPINLAIARNFNYIHQVTVHQRNPNQFGTLGQIPQNFLTNISKIWT